MVKKAKGEYGFRAGGEQYIAVLDFNAICELEELYGKGMQAVMQEIAETFQKEGGRNKDARAILWASLQEHHPGTDLREAGTIVAQLGNGFESVLTEIMTRSGLLGDPEADKKTGSSSAGKKPKRRAAKS